MGYILRFFIISALIFSLPYIFSDISVSTFGTAIIVTIVLAFLNLLIKPFVSLCTLPINILTLGLFGFVVNGFLFWVTARFVEGFSLGSFMSAFLGAFIVSGVNFIISR